MNATEDGGDSTTVAHVPWRGMDVVACLVLLIAVQIGTQMVMMNLSGIERPVRRARAERVEKVEHHEISAAEGRVLLASSAVANWIATGLGLIWLRRSSQANHRDLGFDTSCLGKDVMLGALVFFVSVVPIFMLQAALKLSGLFEGEHPIETLFKNHPSADLKFWAFAAAVLAAPLAEEFFFRVILQGWLERVFSAKQTLAAELVDEATAPALAASAPALATPTLQSAAVPWRRWLPVAIGALVFAAMHLGHGPDPIPLFFLSLLLGYVYQRTHRIWPSLTVHLMLNGTSMGLLLLQDWVK